MSYEYVENQVSAEKLAQIDLEAETSPKSHGWKFFMMRNHYSNLREYQQNGIHWFYLTRENDRLCSCGLVVNMDARIDNSLGHLALPEAKEVTQVFINTFDWNERTNEYVFGAICQACKTGTLRNLNKVEADSWIMLHKTDCSG